jgi:tetratricopeptide (TPR) repeat protein
MGVANSIAGKYASDNNCHDDMDVFVLENPIEIGSDINTISEYEQASKFFDETIELSTQETALAAAYLNKGIILAQINRDEEAISVYKKIELRFSESNAAFVQMEVANALINKVESMIKLGRYEAGLNICYKFIQRYNLSDDDKIIELNSIMHNLKHELLDKLDQY